MIRIKYYNNHNSDFQQLWKEHKQKITPDNAMKMHRWFFSQSTHDIARQNGLI